MTLARVTVREADQSDATAIREVAERSMATSYALAPATIEAIVDEWFDDGQVLQTDAAGADRKTLVADRTGVVIGVVDVVDGPTPETGEIRWLHVHPDFRGEGIGTALLDRAVEWLDEVDTPHVRCLVLADNATGDEFYRSRGYERVGEREVEIDGTPRTIYVYGDEDDPAVTVLSESDRELYADEDDPRPGSLGPFFVVYDDAERTHRYGYQCGHCDGLSTAMDPMGRIECESCGNTRAPTSWDSAYL